MPIPAPGINCLQHRQPDEIRGGNRYEARCRVSECVGMAACGRKRRQSCPLATAALALVLALFLLVPVRSNVTTKVGAPKRAAPALALPKLWGASKKQVALALRGKKLTERYPVPPDDPDRSLRRGEVRVYSLGGGRVFTAWFNASGYAVIVSVDRQEEGGLGRSLEQWKELFREFGLPNCGEPAQIAPAAYIWGPPHNRTGGCEMRLVADDVRTRRVWQVQLRSLEQIRK